MGAIDGAKAEQLMTSARQYGIDQLHAIARPAVARLMAMPSARRTSARGLFTEPERKALVEALAAINSTADLLGRARVRKRQDQIEQATTPRHFDDTSTDWGRVGDGNLAPMAPETAVEYFKGLVPRLGADPQRYGQQQRRRAFTLAAATEETLLHRVQGIIARAVEQTGDIKATARQVNQVLEQAGVSPRSSQYAEMVVRTNLMDAYNQGQTAELQHPDLREFFPVWRYDGIHDGRQGADHLPHFGNYYPSHVPFVRVRGNRPWNCRCTQTAIDAMTWEQLQAQGATLATDY